MSAHEVKDTYSKSHGASGSIVTIRSRGSLITVKRAQYSSASDDFREIYLSFCMLLLSDILSVQWGQ